MNIKEEVQNLKEETSWAYEILQDYKQANKRMFIIILVLIACLIGSIGYTIYLLNDIEYVETTQEVSQESEDGNNNFIGGDGDING